jgi:hypothetical protein
MTRFRSLARRSASAGIASVAAVTLLSGLAGQAHAADRSPVGEQQRAASARGADIYSKGAFSIQLTVHNDTDQTMTLDFGKTTHASGAHWGQQAALTLAARASETVTAYSNDPTGMSMQVVYTLPDGEYAAAMAQDLWVSDNVEHDGVGTGWDSTNHWYQTADPAYRFDVGTHSGGNHIWADAPLGVSSS